MNEALEKDFLSKIDSLRDKTNVLHFSCGADSVAAYLKLKENEIKPICIYHYFIKDLPLHKNYIDWFEKKFNEHIYQFPSVLFIEMFDRMLFQYPVKARERTRNRIGYNMAGFTKEKYDKIIADTLGGDVIFHLGLKYADGIRRFSHLQKNGVSFENKFYPIASFKVSDIQDILARYNCVLPYEYRLWGTSFESPRAWNIGLLKEFCPVTYKKILEFFPLVGAESLRKYAALSKYHKQRTTQYKDFAMRREDYPVW